MTNGNDNNEGAQLPLELQKIEDSLNSRQRRRYDLVTSHESKVVLLECILEERRKSEIGIELVGVILYTLIIGIIVFINAVYFKSEESTKYFVVALNIVYCTIKIIILGTRWVNVYQ
nr:10655_t:CDS:2 [Entrophospora candida]